MGREVRMVPAGWEHPKHKRLDWIKQEVVEAYQPMFDRPFAPAMREWYEGWQAWERGERPDYCDEENAKLPYWEWAGPPPDPSVYRPDWLESERTWVQVYETVSEGTPVSPAFETRQELVEYLVANGDYWDQKRRAEGHQGSICCDPWPREIAEAFVFRECWAPTMVVTDKGITSGVVALASESREES